MKSSDYEPYATKKGYFSRAALVHSCDTKDSGVWAVIIERASDAATLWTMVTIFGIDAMETRNADAVANHVSCKLHNAFAKFEDMVTRSIPRNIDESRGMFDNAVGLQPSVELGKFSFLERVMQYEFEKYLSGYGCVDALGQRV